jgi:hypothetical protein
VERMICAFCCAFGKPLRAGWTALVIPRDRYRPRPAGLSCGGWGSRCCPRPGDGMTSRRLWCRASQAQADACAWRTAIPPSACPAGSRTCARCAPANRAQACWRTSMARRPAGARSRRSPPAVRWSAPGQSRTFRTGPRGRWRVSWCGRGSGAAVSCTSCRRAPAGHAHAMGATAVEGYPADPGSERVDQASGYLGTVPLFEAHDSAASARPRDDAAASPAGSCDATFPDLAR